MNSEPEHKQVLQELLKDPQIQFRMRIRAESLVRKYNLAPATGEDLYQEVMMRLDWYAKVDPPREVSSAYLFKALRNQASTWQTKAHQMLYLEDVEYDENYIRKLSDNFSAVQEIESGILLDEVISSLDPGEQQLLTFVITNYTTRRIAQMLGVSHVTVADRIQQLKKKIKKSIL